MWMVLLACVEPPSTSPHPSGCAPSDTAGGEPYEACCPEVGLTLADADAEALDGALLLEAGPAGGAAVYLRAGATGLGEGVELELALSPAGGAALESWSSTGVWGRDGCSTHTLTSLGMADLEAVAALCGQEVTLGAWATDAAGRSAEAELALVAVPSCDLAVWLGCEPPPGGCPDTR